MAFPRKKPHKLLDIVISQIDTHDLAGVGPYCENVWRISHVGSSLVVTTGAFL
jgi:hypothetical protein